MFSAKKMIEKFSHFFKRDGYLFKLVQLFSGEVIELKETIDRTAEWRDIEAAEGTTLDRIGENVNQPRGQATDPVYRILLKSKIARNLSDGTINKIIEVLSTALSVEPSAIRLQEQWYDPYEPKEAALKVIELPLARLNEAGLDPANFIRIVKRTVAGGVAVSTVELTGTFEFGSVDELDIYDPLRGFGDVNDAEIGGYLGAAFTPNGDIELPI